MSKLFIAADMEGCAGVSSQSELSSGAWGWADARKWMTAEVAAACEAALEAGYEEVIVADGHGNAQNILPDGLPEKVRLIRSWPRPLLQMQGVDAPDVTGCLFIGNHASAQDGAGLLAHTYHGGAIRDLRLNGVSASEGYFNAALAGSLGKPVLLVTGDDAAIEDARRYAPQAELCAVKQATGWRSQASLTPAESCRKIRDATRKAIEKADRAAPFCPDGPYTLEIEFTSQLACEVLSYLPDVERLSAFTARMQAETMSEAMRVVAFSIFYSPTGVVNL